MTFEKKQESISQLLILFVHIRYKFVRAEYTILIYYRFKFLGLIDTVFP